jgi:hypothetical protein
MPSSIPAAKVMTSTMDMDAFADRPRKVTVTGALFCTANTTAAMTRTIKRIT